MENIKTENSENWVLFQIYDCTTERWSPVYCGASVAVVHHEIQELTKKQPNRKLIRRMLGEIRNGVFTATEINDKEYLERKLFKR